MPVVQRQQVRGRYIGHHTSRLLESPVEAIFAHRPILDSRFRHPLYHRSSIPTVPTPHRLLASQPTYDLCSSLPFATWLNSLVWPHSTATRHVHSGSRRRDPEGYAVCLIPSSVCFFNAATAPLSVVQCLSSAGHVSFGCILPIWNKSNLSKNSTRPLTFTPCWRLRCTTLASPCIV
jgi:hypothetical protein